MSEKSAQAFRTISEVADTVGVPQHVLRFWETKFSAIKPLKRGGNRRYYRPEDVNLLLAINRLLYTDGYTIKGVQKLLKEQGAKILATGDTAATQPVSTPTAPQTFVASQPLARDLDANMLASLRSVRDRLASALSEARAV